MGLRCSLTGHRYEEIEAEQEREEDGNKVVVITKEYDVCSRCGQRRLNNETKEVTSTVTEDPEATATQPEAAADTFGEDPAEPEDAGIILDGDDGDPADPEANEPTDWPEQADQTPADTASAEDSWPEAEDSTPQSAADDRPEKPTDPSPAAETADPWPDHEGEDEGVPASSRRTEDAEIDYVGLTPTRDDAAPAPEELTMEKASEAPSAEDAGRLTDTMDLVCPACGFVDTDGHGSLRRGDICPECLDGYLTVDGEHNK